MRFFYRFKWRLLLILLTANVWLYCKRDSGFEYTKYSTISELYPSNPTLQFNKKWTAFNKDRFTAKELTEALLILKDSLDIDKILNEEDKICAIGGWLFKLFKNQRGSPQPITFELTVSQCYHLFNSKKQFKLWCSHFQDMFALFCTAAGLLNRYVEIVPLSKQVVSGFHEVNEVYLSTKKKWVMVDVSRNMILLKEKGNLLTSAEYYDLVTKSE
ncbi:MAG: hypothetical protein ABIP79_09820 [Chitinophagaceae bacterium]